MEDPEKAQGTFERTTIPEGLQLRPELLERLCREELFFEWGRRRFAVVIKLVKDHGYDSNQIDVDVSVPTSESVSGNIASRNADIVVYRTDIDRTPFLVVESKIQDEANGLKQAETNAKSLNAEFFAWSNVDQTLVFKTAKYDRTSERVPKIPYWMGTKSLVKPVPKTNILPPFRDEHQLRSVIFDCHTRIYEKSAYDPARAFDELVKLLFLKLFDEKESHENYRFVVFSNEKPSDAASRMREFFNDAVNNPKYSEIFKQKYNSQSQATLELDDLTIYEVVQSLQGYGLLSTTETIEGSDIKGRVYEQMVGRTFRGELGQFFTPRTIAEFMVKFIDPNADERLLDPACGTGGFLIMSINHVKRKLQNLSDSDETRKLKLLEEFANHKVFGIDINDRVCRVARLNMIMHGSSHNSIINADGLLLGESVAKNSSPQVKEISYRTFRKILSNPPFAGYEKDPIILSKFELGMSGKGEPKSVTKEVLFIEQIIRLLDKGGKAGLVLPMGIFNNPSLKPVRDFLRKHTRILAVVGLPEYAFTHTGTSVKGALLFLEKAVEPLDDYKIFITKARSIGYDSTGRDIQQNDFDKILSAYVGKDERYFIGISQIQDRIDPDYYSPKYMQIIDKMKKTRYQLKKMSELLDFSSERINPKLHPNEVFRYIETNCVDLSKGKIVKIKRFIGRKAPSRARLIARAHDFLIPTARESFKGVAILPKVLDGIVVTNRFLVARPKPFMNPIFLRFLFTDDDIITLIKREATGEIASSISEKSFDNILVPVPSLEEQERIIGLVSQKTHEIKRLRKRIRTLEDDVVLMLKKELFA